MNMKVYPLLRRRFLAATLSPLSNRLGKKMNHGDVEEDGQGHI